MRDLNKEEKVAKLFIPAFSLSHPVCLKQAPQFSEKDIKVFHLNMLFLMPAIVRFIPKAIISVGTVNHLCIVYLISKLASAGLRGGVVSQSGFKPPSSWGTLLSRFSRTSVSCQAASSP